MISTAMQEMSDNEKHTDDTSCSLLPRNSFRLRFGSILTGLSGFADDLIIP